MKKYGARLLYWMEGNESYEKTCRSIKYPQTLASETYIITYRIFKTKANGEKIFNLKIIAFRVNHSL